MIRKIFALALFALLGGVGVVALLETEPGYVLVTYGQYTVETSLWVCLLLALVFVLLLYVMVQLLHALLAGPGAMSAWLGGRKARQSSQLTTRGLINYIEGNWQQSRSQLLKGAEGNEAPLLNYLMAARASYRLGETDRMRRYLGEAEASDSDAGVAVELTQAELKLDAGQYEQALATLVRARRNAGRHPHVLDLLCKAYLGLKDWPNLAELLPELKKHGVLAKDELAQLERTVYSKLLEACTELTSGDRVEALRQQWQKVPGDLRRDSDMLRGYVTLLLSEDAHEAAEQVILRGQKRHWDAGLARLYGFVESGEPAKQLANAEAWLAQHEGDAQLQLALGRMASRCELWGKARDYLETSYKLNRTAEVCAELGRLLAAQGEERTAAAYYREGMILEEARLPDLPLPARPVPGTHRLQQS